MKRRKIKVKINKPLIVTILLVGFLSLKIYAQQQTEAKNLLDQRGEIYIRFRQPLSMKLQALSNIMSIDKCLKLKSGTEILAYLNSSEFDKFTKHNIEYEILNPPSLVAAISMCPDTIDLKKWNCYPTYDQYIQIMHSFHVQYPDLCTLVEFGRSVDGRSLLALKISDNVNITEEEPAFLYTSTMHGDEATGYVLMLRLIEYLLNNYNTNSTISELINTTEIWINPLSNPDGTYSSGNSTLAGATRFNSNNIDLNRNYPDLFGDLHPDGNESQIENLAMIDFMKERNFVFAANFHGGEEVVNYPWDSWTSSEKVHPDDLWYQEVSHEYADTVHANSTGYMNGFDDGISNGGDWYVVYGGRQDYVNFYLHGRETTIEISTSKIPTASNLPLFWNYNYRSFLNYIKRVHTGIYGKITDQEGLPLHAKISIKDYDSDSSEVYSNATNGMYYRMLQDGDYHLIVSLEGYVPIESDVKVVNQVSTEFNLVLQKKPNSINKPGQDLTMILKYTNPALGELEIDLEMEKSGMYEIDIYDISGKQHMHESLKGDKGVNHLKLDIAKLKEGIYFCKIYSGLFIEKVMFVKNKE